MFNTSYPFKFLMSQKVEGEPYHRIHRFTFRCKKGQRYVVLLEEYEHDFFGVKFYLNALAESERRYKELTNFYDAPAIINTCLEVMASKIKEIQGHHLGLRARP